MKSNDKIYQQSNAIITVALNRFSKAEYAAFLKADESISERQKLAQKLIDYLCKKFKIASAPVKVVNRAQPHTTNYSGNLRRKTLGTYTPGREIITLYNLTAIKRQVVSVKTMLGVLLHEFMHHYDFAYLKLGNSLHTAGFYKRISDLESKLK